MAASFARRATTASAEATASTGHDQARQRRPGLQTLLFVINLDELFHIALPLFFLSFKLSILLYVFTRHASPFKRYCLISLAVLYVVYEGYSMVQRRARLRETADRLRRAAEDGQRNRRAPSANGNGDTAPEGAQPTADAPASNQETQQGDTPARPAGANVPHAESSVPDPNAPPPPPRAPARYTATSPLVLNYWIEHVAYIGLEDEDVELGLQLPGGGGAATRAFTPRGYWTYKVFARVIVPLILFVGTLVPEIEKRRRKAIEEREHVIRTVARIEEERQARLAEERERASGQDGQNTSVTATAVNGAPTEGASSTSAEHSATLSGATEQPAGRPLLHSEYSERVLRRRGAAGREFERDPLDVAAEADADEFAEDDLGFF